MNPARTLELLWSNLAKLGPRRLAALGVVGVTLFGAIAVGSLVLSRADYKVLYVGLTPQDSSRIATVLSELGIPFDSATDGSRVSVPANVLARARALLAERGLPSSSGGGYELFDRIGALGLTTFMQEVTRVRALEGEISRSLEVMKDVAYARVHLAFGEKGTFRRNAKKPSASVVVKLSTVPERAPVDAIRHLVAAAVPDLDFENVRVVSSDGSVLAAGGDDAKSGPNKVLELERAITARMKQNIGETLGPVIGFESFESSVAVRLNADQRTTNENIFDPESKVERTVRVVKEAGNSQDNNGDQAASVETNVPAGDASSQAVKSQKSNQRRDEVTNFEISSKAITTTSDGYRVENISVAVVIDKRKLVKTDGTPLDETAQAQKVAEIEKIVTSAVGLDTARGDRLTVSVQDFQVVANVDSESQYGGVSVAIQNHTGSFITAFALVAAVLAIVWFGLRPLTRVFLETPIAEVSDAAIAGSATAASNMALPMPDAAGAAAATATSGAAGISAEAGDLKDGSIPELVERLNNLITSDPDQAVAVIRRWLNKDAA